MFWLIDALRPHRFVELGTHAGASYCAACQAIELLGLHCSCYAIDTWKGDEHAGYYDEKVYHDLAAYHAPKYAAFSRLVRSTFDAAVDHFEDASIDLLHIDGLHTYDAVRHDFETWRPKLTQNAVVLFHDTNVRERDFAVSRFWGEVSADRPHFEFLHGHGLGVLGVGDNYPKAVASLFAAGEEEHGRGAIRAAFAHLGQVVAHFSDTAHATRRTEATFVLTREEWHRQMEQRGSQITALLAERDQLAARGREREVQSALDRKEWQLQIEGRDAKILQANAQVIEKAEEIQVLKEKLSVAVADRENARSEEKRLHEILGAVYSSTSWRVTAPLRAAKRLLTTLGK
ncbi:class I SAM-dependent methyltransferase [Mesorhizobium sp.]|nr:class I SAM-dependent methyltransferase [Mesorhizobium sp.]